MGRGTFFVHKNDDRDKKNTTKKKAENIMRASTYLQTSMIFNSNPKSKKRDSKISKGLKTSIVAMDNEGFRNKRKSKTFIESGIIKNKLASAVQQSRPIMEKEEPATEKDLLANKNMLISMKSIASSAYKSDSKRPSTNAKTSGMSNEMGSPPLIQSDDNFEEEEISDKNRTLSNFSPVSS